MSFVSPIMPGAVIVTDENIAQYANQTTVDGVPVCRGRVPRDYERQPFGSFGKEFDLPLIPRSEWKDRIEEMVKTKTLLSDLVKQAGVPPKNQGQTNYCWCNGVITAIEGLRAMAGLPYVQLSPASVAAPIKGFRNQGGWGGEALEYIIEHGVVPASLWPPNAIDRQYFTDANKQAALPFRVLEWSELRPRSFDEKMTCLLNRIFVPCGYNHMGHEMCSMDPLYFGGDDFGAMDRNSWGSSQEWYVFHERLATPDDAVAVRVMVPSE